MTMPTTATPEIAVFDIERLDGERFEGSSDEVAVEEPLEIRVVVQAVGGGKKRRALAVTMRTPGADRELAAGFLFTEGIVSGPEMIEDIEVSPRNVVDVVLRPGVVVALDGIERQSFVSSSCGVCGKRSIAAVHVHQRFRIDPQTPRVAPPVIHALPSVARVGQPGFARTGGLHAAALFDEAGVLLDVREDVGRHNALDKLVGAQLLAGAVPLSRRLLLLSGRASFELVQKATLAGIPVVAAVGAPSSLAIRLARDRGITLLGFVRDGRLNVYAGKERLGGAAN